MNFGIWCISCWITVLGIHSFWPSGSTCRSKSLPSARVGLLNVDFVMTSGAWKGYLSLRRISKVYFSRGESLPRAAFATSNYANNRTKLTVIKVPSAELLLLCLKASGKLRNNINSFSTRLVFLSDMISIKYNHSFFFLASFAWCYR